MVDQTAAGSWLVALLTPKTELLRFNREPEDGVEISGERFTILSDGGVSASFDRLVDETGTVVGVQCWPVASLARQVEAAGISGPHVRVLSDPLTVQLYFETDKPSHSVRSTGEQSLLGHLLVSSHGRFAIAVDLSELLSESERASIRI